jgi:hypothetical protein
MAMELLDRNGVFDSGRALHLFDQNSDDDGSEPIISSGGDTLNLTISDD